MHIKQWCISSSGGGDRVGSGSNIGGDNRKMFTIKAYMSI